MDAGFTLIVKYGERGFAKKCSSEISRKELVNLVTAKWKGIRKEEVFLSYDLVGAGELYLADEEDMVTMFRLLEECQSGRVHIYVRKVSNGVVSGLSSGEGQVVVEVGECSHRNNAGAGVVEGSDMVALGEHRLLREEWRKLIVGPGQRLSGGAVEFRRASVKYSVQMGFEFVFLKNGPWRVTAACSFRIDKCCPWRIQAVEDVDHSFCICFYERNHTCGSSFGNVSRKRVNHHIISDIIVEDIRSMPSLTPVQVQAAVKKKYGLDISYRVAWKAMDRGRGLVFGDHSISFSMLPVYFEELKNANPGSHVHLDVWEDEKFRRCLFAFQACLLGFSSYRPMIMVDETFLKGRHKGCLLSAVAKDGDDGLFPLAFAVVKEETDDNWDYFFRHLSRAVGYSREIVFISDRSHGILKAVRSIFPDSPHAYCCNHLKANLEYRCRGMGKKARAVILRYFQKCAYVTTQEQFQADVQKMLNVGGYRAEGFFRDTSREMWANAYFLGRIYGQMTSNACESWNSQIREERLLPIVSMIDGIRSKLMQQMCKRRQQAEGWATKLCKNIDIDMNSKVEIARGWDVRKASNDVWEVFSIPAVIVDVGRRTCTCRLWQLFGVPCVHDAGVIFLKLEAKYEYVESYFHTEAYRTAYSHIIVPFCTPGSAGNRMVVRSPDFHQTCGRPKRRRIPSQGENMPCKFKCGRCGELSNHNKKM